MLIDAEPIPTRSFAFAEPADGPAGSIAGPAASSRLGDAAGLGRQPSDDADQAAGRHHQARRPAAVCLAALAGVAAGRAVADLPRAGRSRFSSRASRFSIRGTRPILADEMGLGKTMQAITAMRLLLRSGEIASVLLVCPKPLVTNWQREFEHLGPGGAADGRSKATRPGAGGSGSLPDMPVKIANYEILRRDLRPIAGRRRRRAGRPAVAVRPGGARRVAADQEPPSATSQVGAGDRPGAELGPDRHAGGEQPRRPGGHLRVPRPGLPLAGDEAAAHGPDRSATTCCAAPRTRCSATCRPSCSATPSWS